MKSLRARTTSRQPLHTSVQILDLDEAKDYLRSIENLAREARETSDPAVVLTALNVLALQSGTIQKLGAMA